jgi:uncharacterized protein (DUF433 family)
LGGKLCLLYRDCHEQIVRAVAAGVPQEELLAEYPGLEPEDIQAALT